MVASDAGGAAPWAEASEPRSEAPPAQPAEAIPVNPVVDAERTPIARIDRLTSWSLGLAVCSILLGFFTLVPALILAFRAQHLARSFGTTSADSRVKWAKRISVGLTVIWVLYWVLIIVAASTHNNGGS
jgi:hypothetical protein